MANDTPGSIRPGLAYPDSLEDWRAWQARQRRLQIAKAAITARVKNRGRAPEAEPAPRYAAVRRAGTGSRLTLIAIDSDSPTAIANSIPLLPYLAGSVILVMPENLDLPQLTGEEWTRQPLGEDPAAELAAERPTAVLSLGHYLGAGALAHEVAQRSSARELVVQHGALTPFAPPLPREVTLLAWSEQDGDFWRSRRSDVDVLPVGSQHLWEAAQNPAHGAIEEHTMFLGQIHGAELPRQVSVGSALDFCRRTGSLYRPHPREEDVLSRSAHWLMKKRGVQFADSSIPLNRAMNPVVSIFSTGVLEAAVRGIPAWVYATRPPFWVAELWDRYSMSTWGSGDPTPAPALVDAEPATRIAQILEGAS